MPGLQWCGRRWITGSDDFVVGSLMHLFLNGTCAILWIFYSQPDSLRPECTERGYFNPGSIMPILFTVLMSVQWLVVVVSGILSFASSRGRVLETHKRDPVVPILLYLHVLSKLMQLGVASAAVHYVWTLNQVTSCSLTTWMVIRGLTFYSVLDPVWYFLSFCFMYDPSGSQSRFPFVKLNDYTQMWVSRCECMCCCFVPSKDPAREGAYLDAAKVMTVLHQGLDLVPSDIQQGFLLLEGYQYRVGRKRVADFSYAKLQTSSTKKPIISSQARKFHPLSQDQVKTLEKIEHFAKFYVGAYGWKLYILGNLACGLPQLCCEDPTSCCRSRSGVHIGECCCMCNNTVLHKFSKLTDDQILFSHYENGLYYPGFFVATDDEERDVNPSPAARKPQTPGSPGVQDEMKSFSSLDGPSPNELKRKTKHRRLVIAVRGTMSLQDCLMDGVANPVHIPVDGVPDAMVHCGFLQTAVNVKHSIAAEGKIRIEDWLEDDEQGSTSEVVLLGHSLGAGVAIILTILYREQFKREKRPQSWLDKISCIGYAPPGGLLSRSLAESTRPYTVGCFMGKDLVPRASMHSVVELREALMAALAASRKTKCRTLCQVVCCCSKSSALLDDDPAFDEEFEAQLARYHSSKVRQQLKGCQQRVTKTEATVRDVHPSSMPISGPTPPGGNNGEPKTPLTIVMGHDDYTVDPKDLTEDGIVKMFPPAHIIHYAKAETVDSCCPRPLNLCLKEDRYCPCWISIDDLQEIHCTPFMGLDHMPDRFYRVMNEAKRDRQSGALEQYIHPDSCKQGEGGDPTTVMAAGSRDEGPRDEVTAAAPRSVSTSGVEQCYDYPQPYVFGKGCRHRVGESRSGQL